MNVWTKQRNARNILFTSEHLEKKKKKTFVKMPFLPSEESAAGYSISSLLHKISGISIGIPYRVWKVWKYRRSLSIAIVRRKTGTRSRAESGRGTRAPWISASAIPTRLASRSAEPLSIFFSTYWGQMEHFSEHVARRDMSGTTNEILRTDSDRPFVFIHDAFSLSSVHPMDSWRSVVETRMCTHLYSISKLETSLVRA